MPDFERLLDKLAVDMANAPEQRAAAIGFSKGKAYARRQLLRLFVFGTVGWALGSEILWPWARALDDMTPDAVVRTAEPEAALQQAPGHQELAPLSTHPLTWSKQ